MKHNPSTDKFEIKYAFIDDPNRLSNNIGQVIRIAESEEKKLLREGLTAEFNTKFDEMVNLGTIGEITQMEMDLWSGQAHCVSIHHVVNDKSSTTPIRLVVNSSLRCPRSGKSLNEMLAKGPNLLNDLWGLMIRFRGYWK